MIHAPLAMHMANELLSVPVAGVTLALAAGVLLFCAYWAQRRFDAERFPLMGVIGAFVFAAQMINFPLPGLGGVSGHLGGGVLLAILLGPARAIVTMAAILLVQCLFFQDGGLLALGCNVINMGIVPALLGYGLYRLVLGRKGGGGGASRHYVAAFAGALVGVTAGAALVPIEAHVSGVLAIPTRSFLAVMVGVHLIIGAVEGAITFAVVAFVGHVRPAALGLSAAGGGGGISRKALVVSLLVTAVMLAGLVSWFASGDPDGLEWSYQEHSYGAAAAVDNDSAAIAGVDAWQEKWAPMPDYGQEGWTSVAGLVGTALTLLLVHVAARLLRRRRALESSGT